MKTTRIVLTLLALAAGALLAGCATTDPALMSNRYQMDTAYVQAVENLARNRGVSVHWVNVPERRVPVATAAATVDE